MTTIRSTSAPGAQTSRADTQAEQLPERAPAANRDSDAPAGWQHFQDSFREAPATQLEQLRTRAAEQGRSEVVAPLSGLSVTNDDHHSVASNVLRNYPVKDIYAALYSDPADLPGWADFRQTFLAAPASGLEALKQRASAAGREDLVAPLAGLDVTDDGHHSIGTNILQNYGIKDIYAALAQTE